MEKSYPFGVAGNLSPEDAEREWFARLLWRAFPEARSESRLCDLVAEYLTDEKRTVHPRTVRNWARKENTPHFRYVMKIIALAGAEAVFQFFDPERPRR